MVDIYGKSREKYIGRCVARLGEEDRGAVKRYLDDLTAEGFSAHRIAKIASILSLIAGKMDVPLTKATAEDIKRWSALLERSKYSEWTKHDHRSILRKFIR